METSLHRELKRLYAGDAAQTEVRLEGYRIDAVVGDELVEIQHGSLAAIRRKLEKLVPTYRVRLVKPIVASKLLVKRSRKDGPIVHRRASPKRGTLLELFHELIYLTRVYPHPNLSLEVPLVQIEEWRFPGHGRRRRWRRNDYVVEDQKLISVEHVTHLSSAAHLVALIDCELPETFHSGHLAQQLAIPRFFAQRIAYCFRQMGAVQQVGKQGNTLLYSIATTEKSKRTPVKQIRKKSAHGTANQRKAA